MSVYVLSNGIDSSELRKKKQKSRIPSLYTFTQQIVTPYCRTHRTENRNCKQHTKINGVLNLFKKSSTNGNLFTQFCVRLNIFLMRLLFHLEFFFYQNEREE